MRPKNLPIILCASIALALAPAKAQISNDPSDSFLDAFSTYQRAEKLEGSGNIQAASATYKEAARKLEQISARWPQWQPPIVEYRKKRTSEAIAKVQEKLARGGGGGAVPSIGDDAILGAGRGGTHFENGVEPQLPSKHPDLIPLPEEGFPAPEPEPTPSFTPRQANPGGVSADPIQQIQNQLNTLKRALEDTRTKLDEETRQKEQYATELEKAQREREAAKQKEKVVTSRAELAEAALLKAKEEGAKGSENLSILQAEAAKARKELKNLQIEREAAEEVRKQHADRLANAHKRIEALTKERDDAKKLSAGAEKEIADARKQMELAIKERELLNEKLTKMTVERDDALAQVAKMKESQKQVDRLINENTQLMAKLADAEKQITQFKADGLEKDKLIVDLKKEVGTVKKQLADTQKESQQYQVEMADLKTKLETTAQQLSLAKADSTTNATERKKMQEENELLRGIVVRQMKEQARRDQTRKLVLEQMSKLEGKSKELLNQINYLGQPVVKLTPKERALFKGPQIEISDTEISIAATKPETSAEAGQMPETAAAPTEPAPALAATDAPAAASAQPESPVEPAPATSIAAANTTATPVTVASTANTSDLPTKETASAATAEGPTGTPGNLPAELMPLVQEAKGHFEKAKYRDAAKVYEKILAKVPNSIYALSNLGVVNFREGKLKQAEESFKKAIAISPEDAFAHCTLGIVHYSQGKYDEAVNSLTKALAINPKNATAHNYLGITASQKGWQEAALKELETATSLDPSYADAHFNLAVVFATQQPPNKENARRSYKRATELGAEPDSNLEALLK